MSYSLLPSPSTPVRRMEPDGFPPLVFVHGWGGSRADFIPMSLYLRYYGRRRIYGPNFVFGESIESRIETLGKYLKEVLEVSDGAPVEIVAHSMGGIVTRLAIAEFGLAKQVKTLVTLGTPHFGTRTANTVPNQVAKDLRPDSWFIERLKHVPVPKNISTYSLWSRNDLLVTPATSAMLPGARKIDCTPFTHWSYLLDRRSWATVKRVLSSSPRAQTVFQRLLPQSVWPLRFSA